MQCVKWDLCVGLKGDASRKRLMYLQRACERFLGEENESNSSDGTHVHDCSEYALSSDGRIHSSQCLNNIQEKKTNSMRQMGLVRCISSEEKGFISIHWSQHSYIYAFTCTHFLTKIFKIGTNSTSKAQMFFLLKCPSLHSAIFHDFKSISDFSCRS